jgi:tRNA1(Val) A37 N6-methylase TrmN6
MDQIYTPEALAESLVQAARVEKVQLVADFAAGDGALLKAANKRWPRAALFGSDINEETIDILKSEVGCCSAATHDFFCDTLPLGARYPDLVGKCDVVLLNPPFTCRGSRVYPGRVRGTELRGSKGLAFVSRAVPFLRRGGELVAILPASILRSERDAALMQALRERFEVEQIGEIEAAAFKSYAVSTVILRIRRSTPSILPPTVQRPSLISLKTFSAEIMRGSMPAGRAIVQAAGLSLVHTTDIVSGKVVSSGRRISLPGRVVSGPAVLVPRVGRPSSDKIALLPYDEVVVSDCLFALRTNPRGYETSLMQLIVNSWDSFRLIYGGSCAPYTTIKRLQAALLELGVASVTCGGERSTVSQSDEPATALRAGAGPR